MKKRGKKCGYCRAVYNTRNLFETQNPRFIIESGFKSRAGYNGAHTICRSKTALKTTLPPTTTQTTNTAAPPKPKNIFGILEGWTRKIK